MKLQAAQKKSIRDNPLAADLDHVLAHTEGLWEDLRGKRLFITGGTGFFGHWLLESFIWANHHLDLRASAVVLTRDLNAFRKHSPHLAADPAVDFHIGDIRDFSFPDGDFSHVIHAATTSALATFNNEDPLIKFDTTYGGTRRALDFAARCRAGKFLLTSSGSVYGKQPFNISHLAEDYRGAPDPADPSSALGEAKRAAEFLCSMYSGKYGIDTKIARCFSFVGPYLPLDVHYAIGNFIRDGLRGGPILVNGDGTSHRSYLYAADLAIWLWTILFKAESRGVYNVGSEDDLSIAVLAYTVAQTFDTPVEVRIAKSPAPDSPCERYVPSTKRARTELGVSQTIDLKTAIRRTARFAGQS